MSGQGACTDFNALIIRRLRSSISPDEERALAAHLTGCDECRDLADMLHAHTQPSEPPIPARSLVKPGDVVGGKYRIDRVLGKGGMGMVGATHLELQQPVALKLMLFDADPQLRERFLREARAAVRLRSQHVARVFDVGALEHGAPYIVMEYLEGRDVAAALREQGRLPIAVAADYVLQACDALAEAHACGIVHRDLKPSNLFLTRTAGGAPLVKVLDFGVSKAPAVADLALTGSSTVMGSPAYMAPEQIRAARLADARSDIWSLGVVLYELVAGKLPFDGETAANLWLKVLQEPVPSLPFDVEDPAFGAVIKRCLEKRPPDRYQTVAELAAALAPFASPGAGALVANVAAILARPPGEPSSPSSPSLAASTTLTNGASQKVPVPVPPPPRGWRGAAIVALPVAAAGALAIFLFTRPDEPRPKAAAAVEAPPAPVAAPPPAPAPDAAVTPATVNLEVQAAPAGAEVFLDDVRLGTAPGVFPVAPSSASRRLELRLDGHKPWTTALVVKKDTVVPARLEKRRGPGRRATGEALETPTWKP